MVNLTYNDEKIFKKSLLSHIFKIPISYFYLPTKKKSPFKSPKPTKAQRKKAKNSKQYISPLSNPSFFLLFSVEMKIFAIFTASALLGAFASAAPPPASALDTRQFQVGVTFYGADEGTSFFQTFPADNSVVKISTSSPSQNKAQQHHKH